MYVPGGLPAHAGSEEFHEAFLERAARAEGTEASTVALGAFLTMRLLDQFSAERPAREPTALHYQIFSTKEFLASIEPKTDEVRLLESLVADAAQTTQQGTNEALLACMLSYAAWLDGEVRLGEARDVLTTALRLTGPGLPGMRVKIHLQLARALRVQGQFDAAQATYRKAGELAIEIGDGHAELLSRIGRGIVLQKTGNLPESERLLRDVLRDAVARGDRDAEARACQDLAGSLHHMNRGAEGAPLAYRAFQLYEEPIQRSRALSDTGQILKELGVYEAARWAFLAVVNGDPPAEVRLRAIVELVDLAALTDDRMSFERWRREIIENYQRLPVDERVDFALKVGTGFVRFGRMAEAQTHLEQAVALAGEHGLPEWLFRAETALKELLERRTVDPDGAEPTIPSAPSPELRATIEGLQHLCMS